MAVPESNTTVYGGAGLLAGFTLMLGPILGGYGLIAACALLGGTWAVARTTTATAWEAAKLLTRLVLTASALSGTLAWLIERTYGIPQQEMLAGVAFCIGFGGNDWREVFRNSFSFLQSIFGRGGNPPPPPDGGKRE